MHITPPHLPVKNVNLKFTNESYVLTDSEPLFGLWFESTLVAPDAADSGLVRATAGADNADSADTPSRPHQAIVPDKAEPYSVSIFFYEIHVYD